jgi:two-component system, NtrC family, sensor histidine kinase HydH
MMAETKRAFAEIPKEVLAERDAPPPPSAASPADDELAAMIWRELGGAGRYIGRFRIVALLVITLGLTPFLIWERSAWRLWIFGSTMAVIGALFLRDFFWLRERSLPQRFIPYLIVPVVVLHTAVIVVTGGVESPFFVLYVVIAAIPGMTYGRFKPALALALLPLSLVWLLSVGTAAGLLPSLLPTFLGGGFGPPPSQIFIYTQAAVFTAASLIGGGIILVIRAAVERTARTAVTIRHELVETMRERNRELLSLSGELAHELKNPLASIQGLSALVERKLPAGSKEKEQMGVLVGEVKRMGATLDEFLNFSRPATGLSTRPLRPAELLAEVAQLHEGLAQQRRIALVRAPGDCAEVRGDARKVKQVLVNLVQNALDATPRGGRITLRTEAGPADSALLVVEDTGPGLAPEVRKRLFQPGATTKTGGSGLGLTIARAIAEQHGGSLVLADRPGGGCRATLTLPTHPPVTHESGSPSDPGPSERAPSEHDHEPRS